ncbi:MAG: transporter [Deltaproteobacteria bacterium]|nr:transporter [Deltaproteobacteria bacterium]
MDPWWKTVNRVLLMMILWHFPTAVALAGPPFRTDDPVPIGYRHSEVYLFSTGTRDDRGTSGVGPAVELNYGFQPDMMVHLIVPMAYDAPENGGSHFGYGDTEIGLKYRFVHETDLLPMIGTFPLVEIPTGDENEGLGNGKVQCFLPIWLQKDFGKWTTYGGGGYWINPGPENKNYWFSGILLQYAFSDSFYLGGEVFYQTADTVDGESSFGFNVGGGLPLVSGFQILFSAGRGLTNISTNQFSYYIALYRAF